MQHREDSYVREPKEQGQKKLRRRLGEYGVEAWGRTLISSGNVGYLLLLGSLCLGWSLLKFTLHVSGLGVLLLLCKPGYTLELSSQLLPEDISPELKFALLQRQQQQQRGSTTTSRETHELD